MIQEFKHIPFDSTKYEVSLPSAPLRLCEMWSGFCACPIGAFLNVIWGSVCIGPALKGPLIRSSRLIRAGLCEMGYVIPGLSALEEGADGAWAAYLSCRPALWNVISSEATAVTKPLYTWRESEREGPERLCVCRRSVWTLAALNTHFVYTCKTVHCVCMY